MSRKIVSVRITEEATVEYSDVKSFGEDVGIYLEGGWNLRIHNAEFGPDVRKEPFTVYYTRYRDKPSK